MASWMTSYHEIQARAPQGLASPYAHALHTFICTLAAMAPRLDGGADNMQTCPELVA